MLSTLVLPANAKSSNKVDYEDNEGNYQLLEVLELENNPNAIYSFIDKNLLYENLIQPMALITEEYDHSYYSQNSTTKVAYRVGPVENVQHQFDVPKGSTQIKTISFSGTGSIQYSGSVSAEIKQIVNLSLGATSSGSVSLSYSRTDSFSGPPESSQYNARGYYTAKDYDQYTVVVDKYDVYRIYNNGVFSRYETYYVGTVTVSNVKKPISIEYTKDFAY